MRRARWIVAAILLLGAAGCCSTFDDDFEAARPSLRSVLVAEGLPGAWEGIWHSDENGHEGELRCIITRKEDGNYETRYYANYHWWIFPFSFEYAVPVTAVEEKGVYRFQGGAELGCWIAGGHYEYEGRVERSDFSATYKSEGDHGIFKMKRAEAK